MPEHLSTKGSVDDHLANISVLTHPGQVRKENQDRVGRAARSGAQIAVVADGVGGEAGGAKAAEFAVQGYLALLAPREYPALKESATDALRSATQKIQQQIAEARDADPAVKAMASTVAVLYLRKATATVGHLGDARAYLFRAGQLQRLTRDHSLVQRMVQDGLLSEDEAQHHPQGHILTHSLGQQQVELDISSLPVHEGDLFLLCSDGLWACVPDETLSRELADAGPELSTTTQRLLDCALQAGAPDNVSIALVRVRHLSDGLETSAPAMPLPVLHGTPASSLRRYLPPVLALLALACALVWVFLHYLRS